MNIFSRTSAPFAELYAPESFIRATAEERKAVVNGCGPNGWLSAIVPDHIYGLCVRPACNIHDWMYFTGKTQADKDEADRVFLNNLLRLVEKAGGPWLLQRLRRNRAKVYYSAVKNFGGPAFWAGKNPQYNLIFAASAL